MPSSGYLDNYDDTQSSDDQSEILAAEWVPKASIENALLEINNEYTRAANKYAEAQRIFDEAKKKFERAKDERTIRTGDRMSKQDDLTKVVKIKRNLIIDSIHVVVLEDGTVGVTGPYPDIDTDIESLNSYMLEQVRSCEALEQIYKDAKAAYKQANAELEEISPIIDAAIEYLNNSK